MKPSQFVIAGFAALALAGCGPTPSAPAGEAQLIAAPVTAPAGAYRLDPNHASLLIRVNHLGLSSYTVRITRFDATLNFDPVNPAASSVAATIDLGSVRTDYPGDYPANHPGSPYRTWDEALTRSPDFFNGDTGSEATFQSTNLELTGANTARMTGDLTFRGITAPVTLDVTFNGERVPHPMAPLSALGFSARGTFNRSDFGMNIWIPEGVVSDAVEIIIQAEFHGPPPQPRSASDGPTAPEQ